MTLLDSFQPKSLTARCLTGAAACALVFALACSKGKEEAAPAPAPGDAAAAPAGEPGAAPAASPDAKEQQLLEQARKAATPDERRQIYAQLVRLHPENKAYKHELKKARREARQARRAAGGGQAGQGGQAD